ncbi:MAG: stage 0 sporulation family protein [Desulfuromonadaceae bacterium]|nr:stage 0 sporulation family protein [Desulfuromonadaceae bacterium]
MTRMVSIKFCQAGRHYNFAAEDLDLETGETVVVETARGRSLGIVASPPQEIPEDQVPKETKSVIRKATEADIRSQACFRDREREAFHFCRRRIEERGMQMKLVRAEYLFDGSKIIFYFTSDGRVDFRELVKDLAHQLHARIEMKQIGVRDEAKMVGGIGICGRELCCCSFLSEFSPVSVKMAKEQGLALNPSKISGQCGRLLCCLSYEFDTYLAIKKGFPKNGTRTVVNGKNVMVTDSNYLSGKITLRTEDNQTLAVTLEEFDQGRTNPPEIEPPNVDENAFPQATPFTDASGAGKEAPRPRPARGPRASRPSRTEGQGKKSPEKAKGQRSQPQPPQGKSPQKQGRPPQNQSQPPSTTPPPSTAGGGEPGKKRPNRRRRKNRPKSDDKNGNK